MATGWGRLTWGQSDWVTLTFMFKVGAPKVGVILIGEISLIKPLLLQAYQQPLP